MYKILHIPSAKYLAYESFRTLEKAEESLACILNYCNCVIPWTRCDDRVLATYNTNLDKDINLHRKLEIVEVDDV